MNILHLLLALALEPIFATAYAQLLPVQRNGRYGFSSLTGAMVIEPKFTDAQMFSEGLAAVNQGGKWGFIGTNGQQVVPLKFDGVRRFSEGLAGVSLEGKWGFINRQGELQIEPQFRSVQPFSEGLAGARRNDSSWIFIRSDGAQGVDGVYDGVGEFSKGVAPVSREGEWSFIDSGGRRTIAVTFTAALSFSEDLAAVKDRESGKYGYISREGKFVIPAQFDSARSFSEHLAAVQTGDYWGYITTGGRFAIAPRFDSAELFEAGVAEVSEHWFGKSLFIDRNSHIVLTKSLEPELGEFGGNFSWVTNTIDSVPQNATVFIIPEPDWRIMTAEERTNELYQVTGRTKLQVRMNIMPYMVLGLLPDGRKAIAPFNPVTAVTNYLLLRDFK